MLETLGTGFLFGVGFSLGVVTVIVLLIALVGVLLA